MNNNPNRKKSFCLPKTSSLNLDYKLPSVTMRFKGQSTNYVHKGFKEIEQPLKYFCTGSGYKGAWNSLGFSGYGTYTYPSGVIYEGYFKDGLFDGSGQLVFPNGSKFISTFFKGNFRKDGVIIDTQDNYERTAEQIANYLTKKDRRYTTEIPKNYGPPGFENISKVYRDLPEGCYELGYGYFDYIKSYIVYDEDKIISQKYKEWILKHCRVQKDQPAGHKQENFDPWIFDIRSQNSKYGLNTNSVEDAAVIKKQRPSID